MPTPAQIVITTLRQMGPVTREELQADLVHQRRLTGLEWPAGVTVLETVRQLLRDGKIHEENKLLEVVPEKIVQINEVQRRMF